MSVCNIPFVTSSLKLKHRFASNFGWTPTKFKMELLVILCIFCCKFLDLKKIKTSYLLKIGM